MLGVDSRGYVNLVCARTDRKFSLSIKVFREKWWLVRPPRTEEAA